MHAGGISMRNFDQSCTLLSKLFNKADNPQGKENASSAFTKGMRPTKTAQQFAVRASRERASARAEIHARLPRRVRNCLISRSKLHLI